MRRFIATLIALLACASWVRAAKVQVEQMKLLTPNLGWAATDENIFWTSDGGQHWTDITPKTNRPEEIRAVFFLNQSSGWLLMVRPDDSSEVNFDLASTVDAGVTWSIAPVKIPNLDNRRTTLGGGGQITFVDSLHGWMDLAVASSANFRLGTLLTTSDGGMTWKYTIDSPGVFGSVRFVDINDGWIAGGPGNQDLYVTHDGSKSWRKILLTAPTGLTANAYPIYEQPPIFTDSKHGYLPVTFAGVGGDGTILALFASNDGGYTWRHERSTVDSTETTEALPSAVANTIFITASISKRGRLKLANIGPEGKTKQYEATIAQHDSAVLRLSFLDDTQGWVLTSTGLLSTTNGGASWIDITPTSMTRATDEPGKDSRLWILMAVLGRAPLPHLGRE